MSQVRLEPFAEKFVTHANGIRSGDLIVVAGQVGVDASGEVAGSMLEQAQQALRNVVAVVSEGGGVPAQIVQLTWYVTCLENYHACSREIGKAFRKEFGGHLPAMTLIGVTGLIDPRCQVEIGGFALLS